MSWAKTVGFGIIWLLAAGCSPSVTLAPPEKPLVINMNINIDHDIHIKVDKGIDEVSK